MGGNKMFKGMNAVEAQEYFGKTIDDELKRRLLN